MYYGLLRLGFKDADFALRDDRDGKGVYIDEWRSDKPQPSAETIKNAQADWQADWDSQEYARKRKEEYDQMGNQFEMIFDDQKAWRNKINEIKSRYPKND